MPVGASRLGFWFKRPAEVVSDLRYGCSLFPDYTYSTIWALGEPSTDQFVINNNYVKYTINGNGQGAIGDETVGIGLMYAPNGDGNFGSDDYIKPGTPWETYAVLANADTIGGSNTYHGGFPAGAQVWLADAAKNHYVILRGSSSTGYVIVQYMTLPGEPIIRMKMTYQNSTGGNQVVKMMRAVDPDVDVIAHSTYDTNNSRGYGSIPGTDLVYSYGQFSGKPLSMYIPGNGFTHNTAVLNPWPTYAFDTILAGTNVGNGDNAIAVAWNIGTVTPGQSVSVCCYYICSTDVASIVADIGAN